jgi:hypothetical protein
MPPGFRTISLYPLPGHFYQDFSVVEDLLFNSFCEPHFRSLQLSHDDGDIEIVQLLDFISIFLDNRYTTKRNSPGSSAPRFSSNAALDKALEPSPAIGEPTKHIGMIAGEGV